MSSMKRRYYKYTKEDLESAIKKSSSWANVCRILGMRSATGSQSHIKKRAMEEGIDFSHFTGQAHNRGKVIGPRREIGFYLKLNGPHTKSSSLRIRLIKEGIKNYECENCKLGEWENKPIPLELDHINGNHDDNRLENLRILCCNCHALTPTYGSKNKTYNKNNNKKSSILEKKPKSNICFCGIYICDKAITCRLCRPHKTKIAWPQKEELYKLVWSMPSTNVGQILGVSDKAIEKRCKALGIDKPTRGYWAKKKAGVL